MRTESPARLCDTFKPYSPVWASETTTISRFATRDHA